MISSGAMDRLGVARLSSQMIKHAIRITLRANLTFAPLLLTLVLSVRVTRTVHMWAPELHALTAVSVSKRRALQVVNAQQLTTAIRLSTLNYLVKTVCAKEQSKRVIAASTIQTAPVATAQRAH